MVDMNKHMNDDTEKALASIKDGVIDAHIVYKDDHSELDVAIAVGSCKVTRDDDIFYHCRGINDLRAILKGAYNMENNNSDFFITSFTDGSVRWEAK